MNNMKFSLSTASSSKVKVAFTLLQVARQNLGNKKVKPYLGRASAVALTIKVTNYWTLSNYNLETKINALEKKCFPIVFHEF